MDGGLTSTDDVKHDQLSSKRRAQKKDELQDCYRRIADLSNRIQGTRNKNQALLRDWNARNGNKQARAYKPQLRGEYEGHFGKVYSLDFGCDSQFVCTASQDGLIIVWNALNGSKQLAIPLKSSWVMTCAFSPTADYHFIASGGLDNTLSIHKCNKFTEKGLYRELSELTNTAGNAKPAEHTSAGSFSQQANNLAIQKGYISGVQFLSNEQILSSCGDSNIVLWDLEKSAVVTTFEGHYGDVMSIDYNQHKSLFVSGSIDHSSKIWDVRDSTKCEYNFSLVGNNESDINSVKWFIDNNSFLSGLENGKTLLFDLRSCRQISEYVYDAKNDPNPQQVYSTGPDVTSPLDAEIGSVSSVDVSSSGQYIFVSYDNGKINMFDTVQARKIHEMNHLKRISACMMAPNGYALAAACFDSKLRIYA